MYGIGNFQTTTIGRNGWEVTQGYRDACGNGQAMTYDCGGLKSISTTRSSGCSYGSSFGCGDYMDYLAGTYLGLGRGRAGCCPGMGFGRNFGFGRIMDMINMLQYGGLGGSLGFNSPLVISGINSGNFDIGNIIEPKSYEYKRNGRHERLKPTDAQNFVDWTGAIVGGVKGVKEITDIINECKKKKKVTAEEPKASTITNKKPTVDLNKRKQIETQEKETKNQEKIPSFFPGM